MLFQGLAISLFVALASAQCSCSHNNDAGRWKDKDSPAGALLNLNPGPNGAQACYKATGQGTLCVTGDASQMTCLREFADNAQSYHGDWFLYTAITCGGLTATMT